MAELVQGDPDAQADDLVLEVRRVEDARSVAERLRVPKAAWAELLAEIAPRAGASEPAAAYQAAAPFWDWLAENQAVVPPGTPSIEPVAPPEVDAAWLRERHREWQEEAGRYQ